MHILAAGEKKKRNYKRYHREYRYQKRRRHVTSPPVRIQRSKCGTRGSRGRCKTEERRKGKGPNYLSLLSPCKKNWVDKHLIKVDINRRLPLNPSCSSQRVLTKVLLFQLYLLCKSMSDWFSLCMLNWFVKNLLFLLHDTPLCDALWAVKVFK